MVNLAGRREHEKARKQLRGDLDAWMRTTADPRAATDDDRWNRYPYYGSQPRSGMSPSPAVGRRLLKA